MLRRLDEGTGNVLGYEVKGKLTEKEFETLSEEFKAVVAEHGKVRLLVRMSDIPRMELGALAEDLKLAPYANDIKRYAIVSDSTVIEWTEKIGDFFIVLGLFNLRPRTVPVEREEVLQHLLVRDLRRLPVGGEHGPV